MFLLRPKNGWSITKTKNDFRMVRVTFILIEYIYVYRYISWFINAKTKNKILNAIFKNV